MNKYILSTSFPSVPPHTALIITEQSESTDYTYEQLHFVNIFPISFTTHTHTRGKAMYEQNSLQCLEFKRWVLWVDLKDAMEEECQRE